MNRFSIFVLLLALADAALAQTPGPVPGQVRAQEKDVTPVPVRPLATGGQAGASLADRAEDMRRLVQNIAGYARGLNRNFLILVNGGIPILSKMEETGDLPKPAPATTYMRTIDGVMVESLFFGRPEVGGRTNPERRERFLKALEPARQIGLPVFSLDYAALPEAVEESYQRNAELGFASYAAPAMHLLMNKPASLPLRPFRENPHPILKLGDVRNFVLLKDSGGMGSPAEFAMKMHETNYDLVIVEVFHRGRDPLPRQAIETLRYKKVGAKRLVLAYMDIAVVDTAKYYWKPEYKEGNPAWISAPVPGFPDRHFVEYWRAEWQKILYGDNTSYLYGIVRDLGFDGVLLDGIDVYRRFDEPDFIEKD